MVNADTDPPAGKRAAIPESGTLRAATRAFQRPSHCTAAMQIANSFIPLLAIVAAMYMLLPVTPIIAIALAVPAAGFVVRIFIIQHDCGHGSFLPSVRANTWVGRCCSLFTWTPYSMWRRQHAGHHATWNNLDERERADLYSSCLTTTEFAGMSAKARRRWSVLQHPVVALGVLPVVVFLGVYRFAFDAPASWRAERRAVHLTNAALVIVYGGLGFLLGGVAVVIVQGSIMLLASTIGVWLFSVQHRFENAVWLRRAEWNPIDASLGGTSYLMLPPVLQWFTGNIGFHHVHHLNPHVPNYNLAACHATISGMAKIKTMTLRDALRSWRFALWSEDARRMQRLAEQTGRR